MHRPIANTGRQPRGRRLSQATTAGSRGRRGALAGSLLVAAALSAGCSRSDTQDQLPEAANGMSREARFIDSTGLETPGFGSVNFVARDGNRLEALTFRGSGFDPRTGPIWFVMHGASRAAERYLRSAAPAAERHDALAVVIHFPKSLYPSSSDYTVGVTTRGRADGPALAEGRWKEPGRYLYAEVERVFDGVRRTLGGEQAGYYLFGHSAGAQFTHRLMTFLPRPRALRAVAANAGWYTLPLNNGGPEHTMPYGLKGSPVEPRDLEAFLSAPFVVLLGERDTTTPDTDRLVRGTPEAMAQGPDRVARGRFYFTTAEAQARALNTPFAWQLGVVPRARHSAAQMMDSAVSFLFGPSELPCTPSRAVQGNGLVITEMLADPPKGAAGDANGDGVRDPADDEFVEIVNEADTPVCLTGWALGDVKNPERHVFPIAPALPPGGIVVVFGGGVPTGDFGGAATLTAQFGGRLSLTNDGDVLTLRDTRDKPVARVSWGDCAGAACAEDHIPGSLGVAASMVREPGTADAWAAHAGEGGRPYSPGRRSDGSEW